MEDGLGTMSQSTVLCNRHQRETKGLLPRSDPLPAPASGEVFEPLLRLQAAYRSFVRREERESASRSQGMSAPEHLDIIAIWATIGNSKPKLDFRLYRQFSPINVRTYTSIRLTDPKAKDSPHSCPIEDSCVVTISCHLVFKTAGTNLCEKYTNYAHNAPPSLSSNTISYPITQPLSLTSTFTPQTQSHPSYHPSTAPTPTVA